MHDTRFSFIEWAAKTGNKTECIVCICNIYIHTYCIIYIIYYIYISISQKRSVKTLKMIVFNFLSILYILYIYIQTKTWLFIPKVLNMINYSSIKTHHYPILQTSRIFLIGNYVNHFCIFFTGTFLGLNNLLESMMSSFLLVLSPQPYLKLYSAMSNQGQ